VVPPYIELHHEIEAIISITLTRYSPAMDSQAKFPIAATRWEVI